MTLRNALVAAGAALLTAHFYKSMQTRTALRMRPIDDRLGDTPPDLAAPFERVNADAEADIEPVTDADADIEPVTDADADALGAETRPA